MQGFGRRVDAQVLERRDLWFLPAAERRVVVDFEHVVGEVFAKAEVPGVRFRLQLVGCCQFYL